MAACPAAKADDLVAIEAGDRVIVQGADGSERAVLDRFSASVWRLCDGSRAVRDIAAALTAAGTHATTAEQVWGALDRLADGGLLEARVTPPAGTNRLSRRWAMAGGTAGILLRTSPAAAQAPSGGPPATAGQTEPKAPGEQGLKQQEASMKATQESISKGQGQEQFQKRPAEAINKYNQEQTGKQEEFAAKRQQDAAAKQRAMEQAHKNQPQPGGKAPATVPARTEGTPVIRGLDGPVKPSDASAERITKQQLEQFAKRGH